MNSDDIFTIMRNVRTRNVNLDVLSSDMFLQEITKDDIIKMIKSDRNMDVLINAIYSKSDPLRNSGRDREYVRIRIQQFLDSWIALGKFDKLSDHRGREVGTSSVSALIKSYNKEFVNAFANKIIPYDDPTKVKSVTDPSGLFAQQTFTVGTRTKPIPFYERAIYKRLADKNIDLPMDETESPFYVMDRNPHLSSVERKKTNKTSERESHLERGYMQFRMIPKY